MVLAGWPHHQVVFILLPVYWDWHQVSLCVHYSRVESRFFTALCQVPLVLKPAKVAHLPGVRPQAWLPKMWLESLTPQEGYPPTLLGHLLVCGSQLNHFFFPHTRLCAVLSLQPCCKKAVLLVFRLFSVRVALYIVAVLVCVWREVSSGFFHSAIFILPPLIFLLLTDVWVISSF